MKVASIVPKSGYVVVKRVKTEEQTDSGIVIADADNDFVTYGEVITAGGNDFPSGTCVIYHVLDALTFKATDSADTTQEYALLKEAMILGTYAN